MSDESGSIWKFALGMVTGVAASFLYVRYEYQLPAHLAFADRMTSSAIVKVSELDLYNPDRHPAARKRALAVILGHRPELLIDIDSQQNDAFFKEVLRRRAEQSALQLREQYQSYPQQLNRPGVRARWQRILGEHDDATLQQKQLLQEVKKDKFLTDYIHRHQVFATDEALLQAVLRVEQNRMRPAAIGYLPEVDISQQPRPVGPPVRAGVSVLRPADKQFR